MTFRGINRLDGSLTIGSPALLKRDINKPQVSLVMASTVLHQYMLSCVNITNNTALVCNISVILYLLQTSRIKNAFRIRPQKLGGPVQIVEIS